MKKTYRIALWIAVTGAVFLPALSNTGYQFFDLEYIAVILFSVVLGTLLERMARRPRPGTILLTFLTSITVIFYFGGMISQSPYPFLISVLCGMGLSAFMLVPLDQMLKIAGIFALSQIISAAVFTPSYLEEVQEWSVKRPNRPSVIHLMLDEHVGMATIPPEAVSPEKIKAFMAEYVKRGFIVFTRAYTADKGTELSLSRLFNPDSPDSSAILRKNPDRPGFIVPRSSAFDLIAKDRVIDLTYIGYVDLESSLSSKGVKVRAMRYNENIIREAQKEFPLSLRARMIIAGSVALRWLHDGVHSPLISWFLVRTDTGHRVNDQLKISSYVHPFVSLFILDQLSDRLACCGSRGTYYFAHLLTPHNPYFFNEHCEVLPTSEWRSYDVTGDDNPQRLADRLHLYRLHFDQATCLSHHLFALIDNLSKRKETEDAVILLHSDHGARIRIEDYKKLKIPGYSPTIYERDWRGSFLALKIPGITGRIIDRPVRLDTLYRNLLANHFEKIDFEKLKPLEDSPY